ncbi:MAG: hypothetical protein A2041_09620 [Bacteroidetes bacterium GWA2_31_9b]|nr:MAG: hypothetical protein A2041_09620 [Bacteroidetes bacterium GWA2_31_9b]
MNNIYSETFNVKDKVIAIIGASGILGTEYVKLLGEAQAKLSIGDINPERCEELAEQVRSQFNSDCISFSVDNTDSYSIESFIEKTVEKYGRIDVLINNAQIKPEGFYAPFEQYKKETLTKVIDGNLVGVVIACQIACKYFIKQGYGNIINISSIYGVVGSDQRLYDGVNNPYFEGERFSSPVSYAVSKAGVISLTRFLASYYREKNIRVNCLTPGGVFDNHDQTFSNNYSYRTLLGRMADRKEYNGAILFLASDASSYMTGANLLVDGGWTVI